MPTVNASDSFCGRIAEDSVAILTAIGAITPKNKAIWFKYGFPNTVVGDGNNADTTVGNLQINDQLYITCQIDTWVGFTLASAPVTAAGPGSGTAQLPFGHPCVIGTDTADGNKGIDVACITTDGWGFDFMDGEVRAQKVTASAIQQTLDKISTDL